MNYKYHNTDQSDFSTIFESYKSNPNDNTLFEFNFISEKTDLILNSNDHKLINESIFSLQNYLQKYPDESIEILVQNNFLNLLFVELIEDEKPYANSIISLFFTIFQIASQKILEDFLTEETIRRFIQVFQENIADSQMFCEFLLMFTLLLEQFPSISEILILNNIIDNIFDFEEKTSDLNENLNSKLFDMDETKFKEAHRRMEIIEKEEKQQQSYDADDQIQEEDFIEPEQQNDGEKVDEEEKQKRLVEFLTDIMQDYDRYTRYLYQKQLRQKKKDESERIKKREDEKNDLLKMFQIEEKIKFRSILFNFLYTLIQSNFNLFFENIESSDVLVRIIYQNFYKRQVENILCSLLQIIEIFIESDSSLFLTIMSNLKNEFLKVNLIKNNIINEKGLIILRNLFELDSEFYYFNEFLPFFQNSLVLSSSNSQMEKSAIMLLEIIQHFSSDENFYQILNKTGVLSQICDLMKKSKYEVSSEAFSTFYIATQSIDNQEFIQLVERFKVIEACIGFMESGDDECVSDSLNVILRMIQILNSESEYEHIFDSFEQNCDFEEFDNLAESENEEIAQLAASISDEINAWKESHC